MPETSQIDAALLGYGPAEPNPITETPPSATPVSDDDASSSASGSNVNDVKDSKASLRQLMVSCIDSALEELGPLGDISRELHSSKPILPPPSPNAKPASSMPSAEDLYGPASPKICPELELRGRIRRAPRYQRRGSVTKFSLSNALKQVQKEDREGKLKPSSPTANLWKHLYQRPGMKRTALDFRAKTTTLHTALAVEGPATKRRRACL